MEHNCDPMKCAKLHLLEEELKHWETERMAVIEAIDAAILNNDLTNLLGIKQELEKNVTNSRKLL